MSTESPPKSPTFQEVVARSISRRTVMVGSASAALFGLFGCSTMTDAIRRIRQNEPPDPSAKSDLMDFEPVLIQEASSESGRRWPLISNDYQFDLILPWGDPIDPKGPKFSWPPTKDQQAIQVGSGHDGMTFFPSSENPNGKGALALNHEFVFGPTILGKSAPDGLDDVRTSQHAHGVSIVNLERIGGKWTSVGGANVRRIHVNTPVEFSGPAKDHELLQNLSRDVAKGTLNNCANGHTPWGTYLTCEENWAYYFGRTGDSFEPTEEQKRYLLYGFGAHGWQIYDPRFNLQSENHVGESRRFGWVVEIDPHNAEQVPVKHTALGRMGHEGATVVVGKDDRVVVYMGDDSKFEHIYKYVSNHSYQAYLKKGKSPLADGRLYVAKFNADNTGEWLLLSMENEALAKRFKDDGEIAVYTRIAATLAGGTPMDRPEWITVGSDQSVYCSLTNNDDRTITMPGSPEAPNIHGHIIRWKDSEEHVGERFAWDIFKIASESQNTETLWDSPDGIWVDPEGRLFVETDGSQKDSEVEINNQLLVMDTQTGHVRRLFTGVNGCEITGLTTTPDQKTMFVNVQHPGLGNFRPEDPRAIFPALGSETRVPRDCTVVITRKDGGIVGS